MVDDSKTGGSDSQAVHRRAEQQDALDAILPFDQRDQLAALLTDDDVETLKHLASMGENTLRALASDLGYLEAWCQLATGAPPPLAGARIAAVKIRRASPLGPGQARRGSGPRYAGERRARVACRAPAEGRRTARFGHGAAAAELLVDPHPLARSHWGLRCTVAEERAPAGSQGQ